jgi:hypothetical protein
LVSRHHALRVHGRRTALWRQYRESLRNLLKHYSRRCRIPPQLQGS